MSTISSVSVHDEFFGSDYKSCPPSKSACWVAVKGAPEVIKERLVHVPNDYDATFKQFAMNGSRVIALAWKWILPSKSLEPTGKHWAHDLNRDDVECDLHFCGFVVFTCPLKKDTAAAIEELHESLHRIVMITGDNPLTACHVARELAIVRRPTLILDVRDSGKLIHAVL
jgi:cation-transporting ATPase 13A1